MKKLEIFKAGKQIAGSGETLSFSEDDLRATVDAYDPALHEAPIVVGHHRDNAPAYGWIKSLQFAEGGSLHADTDQVMPEFAEMVQAGRFKKRSASFYKPDSPANPVPGVYYLRHLGFLGAQPPAVKGLADPEFSESRVPDAVEFNDSADDVIEFSDVYAMATLFRRMREFFVEKFGIEDADKTIPGWIVEDLEAEARRPIDEPSSAPAFSEGNNPKLSGATTMTEQEIQDLQAKAARVEALEAENASFKERETDLAGREAKLARAEIAKSVDALIDEGKILPADRENEINYLESLDNSNEIEFSEGEGEDAKKVKSSQRAYYLGRMANRPPVVDFEERSREPNGEVSELDFAGIGNEAAIYRENERKAGRHITASQAVAAVKAGKHKK